MQFSKTILLVMALFSLIGGIDRMLGNRFGLGKTFENGIQTMGQLALSMIGIIVLSPVIADVCAPIVAPIFQMLGADPSVFAGSILACDMGGAQLAKDLATDPYAAKLSGILIASMLGTTISFTIPVAIATLSKQDIPYGAKGILCGVAAIPIGVVIGGMTAGFSLGMILHNAVPVLMLSLLIILGLWKAETLLIRLFQYFGWLITALSTIGIVCAGIQLTTGITLIPGLGSIKDAFVVVGEIAIVLSGAFPLVAVLQKLLYRPILKCSSLLGINNTSAAGLIATLANSIATFDLVKQMDPKGKVLNMAFAVSGAFVFGDHLAFTASFDAAMIPALITGKLSAGILAICIAFALSGKKSDPQNSK